MIEPSSDPIWYNSLRFRLLALLTIALLPIGLIAVNQTREVSKSVQAAAESSLLAMTAQAASVERQSIERARGVADAVRAALPLFNTNEQCSAYLAQVLQENSAFSFVGILPPDGKMTCSSSGTPYDFSEFPNFKEIVEARKATVEVNQKAPLSGQPVVIVTEPIFLKGSFKGFISISLPQSSLGARNPDTDQQELLDLITFNGNGEIISTFDGIETGLDRLPADVTLASLTNQSAVTFTSFSAGAIKRSYASVPIEKGRFYALGVWKPDQLIPKTNGPRLPTVFFPLLMWVISLGVALFAVHSLVTRHVKTIRHQMARFASTRQLPDFRLSRDVPNELREIQSGFGDMAEVILRDEATLEDAMRQKNMLFKEVHHRVKNNLQLISSIINMQVRKSGNTETRNALRRIQDRVISLATVHRDLYQGSSDGQVNAGQLVEDVVNNTLRSDADVSLAVKTDIQNIMLYPDQAIPLSLFASEAATNALKYAGAAEGSQGYVNVSLHMPQSQTAFLKITNSVADAVETESTGLGSQLLQAFAVQLGGTIEYQIEDGTYAISLQFEAAEFEPETTEY